MKAICVDGTEVQCGNFKAVKAGVVLTADRKREKVIGFVPTENLSYILPDDVAAERAPAAAGESDQSAASGGTAGIAVADDGPADLDDVSEDAAEPAAGVEATAAASSVEQDEDAGTEAEAQAVEPTSDDAEPGDETGDADDATDEVGNGEERGDAEAVADEGGDAVAGLLSGAPEATTVDPDDDLRRLAGLGDTYAERLRAAGIGTVSDLRHRSVDDVADVARVPRGRAERWLRLVTARDDDDDAGTESTESEASTEETGPEGEPSDAEASESG
jgi:predicted flap endonuclease-1-like 5' DNA nuclease